ncbi:MAG: hypothetical protein JZU53_07005 [Paludibacter sp.]|nr:hypothetical protein [Paludibacter sp.]
MKKKLAITFLADDKKVRSAVALLTGECLTDAELEEKYFSNNIEVDLEEELEEAGLEMIVAFTALITDKKTVEE